MFLITDLTNTFSSKASAYVTSFSLLQIYFIAVLYSYAIHLRRGTFRALLASQQAQAASKVPSSLSSSNNASSRRPSALPTSGNNGYAYSHLRNSSLASNGNNNNNNGQQEVIWEGGLDDDAGVDAPLYNTALAGDESSKNSRWQ